MPFIEHFLYARPLPSSQIAPPAPCEVGTIIISVLQTGHHCSEAVSGTRSWVTALMRGVQRPSPFLFQNRMLPHLGTSILGAHTQTCPAPPGPPGHLPSLWS